MMTSEALADCYRQLQLRTDATIADVDAAYFRLKARKIQAGDRADIDSLKKARETIKAHLQELESKTLDSKTLDSKEQVQNKPAVTAHREQQITAPKSHSNSHAEMELDTLVAEFLNQGFTAKASIQEQVLNLGIRLDNSLSPSQITAKIRHTLAEVDQEVFGLSEITTVRLYGLDEHNKAQWKKSFPLPEPQLTADDVDLYSFNNRFSNTLVFPGLFFVGAMLSSVEVIKALLFGVHIWIHEFGHATIAWLSGYRATPLPFGWTNVGESQSLFVYVGVLTLLGLLFYTGQKEQSRWSMGLAIGLAVVQFCMTWLISEDTFYMLLSFGGIGGEFYLSTLLIVSFYFPLPEYWRWDFFRYPAVLFASFVLMGSSWQWRQIDRGLEAIPWGTLFGGSEHIGGDMNQLSLVYGWSDQQIIDTYNSIGAVCAIAILSTYFYIFLKQRNYSFLQSLWLKVQK